MSTLLPARPHGRWMLAQARTMAREPLRFLEETYACLGDVVELPMPRQPVLLLDDPAGVDHVLRAGHHGYGKRTVQYDTLALVTGNGLLTTEVDAQGEGPGWLAQRRIQQPAYHGDRLADLVATTVSVVDELLAGWTVSGSVIDIEAAMSEVSLEVVSRAVLGSQPGETRDLVGSVATALDRVIARARNPLAPALGLPSPGNLRLRGSVRRLDEAAARLVASRRTGPRGDDLVSLLLAAGLTQRQVRDEVITTLVAGHETVATALTWTWWLLATHPDAQRLLVDEAARVLGPDGRPEVADLVRLVWTRQVVDESLRLYPPAWAVTRRALIDDVVSGVDVRAGTLVVISPWTLHRRPSAWAEPRAFRPERFAPGATVPRDAYLPFGAGPRLCIGRDVALAEAVVVLARIAQRWSFTPVDGPDVRPQAHVTLRPRGGLRLRLSRACG